MSSSNNGRATPESQLPVWLRELSVAEHAVADPGFYVQLLTCSVACCAAFCVGCMLVYLQAVLKPLVFSIFLMYLLSPLVHLLTTPVRVRAPRLLQRWQRVGSPGSVVGGSSHRRRQRSPAAVDDVEAEEELRALVQPGDSPVVGGGGSGGGSERAAVHPAGGIVVACPDWLAIIFVMCGLFTLLWMLCNAFIAASSSLQAKFPVYRDELLRLLERFTRWLERLEPRAKDVLLAGVEKWLRELPLPALMEDTLTAFFGGLESLLLVLLFTVYLLQGRTALKPVHGARADELQVMQAEIDRQVRRYVVLKTAVCVGVGALVGLIFTLLQPDLAFIVGMITFVSNFVPNVGAIFATMLPMPLVLLDPGVSVGVRALAFLLPLVCHAVVGNFIEPKVFGHSMELHPVMVLFSLAFWAALWGISGAILSVPLTATCRIALSAMRNPWSETLLRLIEGRREYKTTADTVF